MNINKVNYINVEYGVYYNGIIKKVNNNFFNHSKLILNFNKQNNLNIQFDSFIRYIILDNIIYIREHNNDKHINEFIKYIKNNNYDIKEWIFNTINDQLINKYGGKW